MSSPCTLRRWWPHSGFLRTCPRRSCRGWPRSELQGHGQHEEERLTLKLTAGWKKKNCLKFNVKVNTSSQLQFLHCSYYGFCQKYRNANSLACIWHEFISRQVTVNKNFVLLLLLLLLSLLLLLLLVVAVSSWIFLYLFILFRLYFVWCLTNFFLGMCKKKTPIFLLVVLLSGSLYTSLFSLSILSTYIFL